MISFINITFLYFLHFIFDILKNHTGVTLPLIVFIKKKKKKKIYDIKQSSNMKKIEKFIFIPDNAVFEMFENFRSQITQKKRSIN